jgi:thioredoxin reductase (NADPH)
VSVYYAATLVEAMVCMGDPVVVVGGGNSAGQATLFLAQHATAVRLLIRGGDLGKDMSRYLVDRIVQHPRVEVMTHTEVREVVGEDGVLQAVEVENNRTRERGRLPARAMFVFIGAEPRTEWLGGQVAVDRKGFVLTGPDAVGDGRGRDWDARDRGPLLLETNLPGVLAAGDVRTGSIKRVASAVGEGAMAIRLVHEHLQEHHSVPRPG